MKILAPDPKLHREELFDLASKVFPHPNYFAFQGYLRNGYVDGSRYDWKASRIGILDGRIVTHFGVWDYQMRVGRSRLRTAGVGLVATHGEYRNRGLMARTVAGAIPAMREAGYDLSVLFGIGNFYHRFGYTRAWSLPHYFLEAKELPQDGPRGKVFDLPCEPTPALDRLYNRCFATTTGTAVRPFYRTRTFGGYLRRKCRGWGPSRKRLSGYVLYEIEASRLKCVEAVGDPEATLRVLGRLARESACSEVQFITLPYNSALARRLRRGNSRFELHHRRSGEAMARTIDLARTLENLSGELTRRLGTSPMAAWSGELLVANREESALLSVRQGRIGVNAGGRSRHAICGGDEITQLLLGTDDPQEIATEFQMRLSGDVKKLLPVLFPNHHPVLHSADHF